jgi:hypothetical protein
MYDDICFCSIRLLQDKPVKEANLLVRDYRLSQGCGVLGIFARAYQMYIFYSITERRQENIDIRSKGICIFP